MTWAWQGKCESDTVALCKSNGRDTWHGMVGERHGRGMGTSCYVWIGLKVSTSLWQSFMEREMSTLWFPAVAAYGAIVRLTSVHYNLIACKNITQQRSHICFKCRSCCNIWHVPAISVFFHKETRFIWVHNSLLKGRIEISDCLLWTVMQQSKATEPLKISAIVLLVIDFLSSSGSGTGSTQPREVNWGATWIKSSGSGLENRY